MVSVSVASLLTEGHGRESGVRSRHARGRSTREGPADRSNRGLDRGASTVGLSVRTHDSIPFIRASQPPFFSSENFFYHRADSLVTFLLSKCIGGDSARIRSGFAFREKEHRSRQIFEIFLQNPQISCPVGAKVAFRMPRGVPFRFFFCAFSTYSPARMSDRPRARATRRWHPSRAARHSTTRGAVPRRCTARRRRWTPRRRYCDGSSPTRRVRVSREDARGSLARARSSSLARAQPRPSPSRFERALTPSPPRAPVASLPQAPRSSRAC